MGMASEEDDAFYEKTFRDIFNQKKQKVGRWILMSYKGEYLSNGHSLTTLKEDLEQRVSEICFAVIRVDGIDQQESVVSVRPKLVRVDWIGTRYEFGDGLKYVLPTSDNEEEDETTTDYGGDGGNGGDDDQNYGGEEKGED